MPEVNASIWWWSVLHKGHPAFYLRSFLPADFRPGARLHAHYALTLEGKLPVRDPVCGTCGELPETNDCEVVERASGQTNFLREMRRDVKMHRRTWPTRSTDERTCWLCNANVGVEEVPLGAVARAYRVAAEDEEQKVRCCGQCAEHLRRND